MPVSVRQVGMLWPFAAPLALPLIYGLLFQWTLVITLLSFLIIIVLPLIFVGLFALTIGAARARRVKRACVAGGALLLLLAQPVFPAVFWHPLYKAGLWAGLAPFYGQFKTQVAALPQNKGPRRLAIDFGYAAFLGHGLIFDESDRIATTRKPDETPLGWIDQEQARPCDGDVIGLGRHYYACIFSAEL
jgi:hypothetical protein